MDTKQEWTVVIYGLGFWGCGNTYAEAVGNIPKGEGFSPLTDEHTIVVFSEPVRDVWFSPAMEFKWVDGRGEVAWTHLASGLKPVLAAAK